MSDISMGMGFGFNVQISDDMMKQVEEMGKNSQQKEVPQKQEKVKSGLSKKDNVKVTTNKNNEMSNVSAINFNGTMESSSQSQTTNTTVNKGNMNINITERTSHSETVTKSWGGNTNIPVTSYENIPSHKNEIKAAGEQSFDSDKVKALKKVSEKELSVDDQKLLVDVIFNKISFDSSIMDVLKAAASNGTFNDQGKEYLFEKVNSSKLFGSSKQEVFQIF